MKNKKKMNNKGFSLVELIIVIAIMAVLIAILAPQYLRFVERGRAASDRDNIKEVVGALQVHAVDTLATHPLAAGTITIGRGTDTTVTADDQVEALTNAGLSTTIPHLTNTSTFTSVTITITNSGGNIQVTSSETP